MFFPSFPSYFFPPRSHFHMFASYFTCYILVYFSLICSSFLFMFLSLCHFPLNLSVTIFSVSSFTYLSFFFTFLSYFSIHLIFFLHFLSLLRTLFTIFFTFLSTSFHHCSDVFAPTFQNQIHLSCYTTKASRYWLLKPEKWKLHKKLHLSNSTSYECTPHTGECIVRFKRQRFSAEVLLSALKEWFPFF
jgi:hypothetical protein